MPIQKKQAPNTGELAGSPVLPEIPDIDEISNGQQSESMALPDIFDKEPTVEAGNSRMNLEDIISENSASEELSGPIGWSPEIIDEDELEEADFSEEPEEEDTSSGYQEGSDGSFSFDDDTHKGFEEENYLDGEPQEALDPTDFSFPDQEVNEDGFADAPEYSDIDFDEEEPSSGDEDNLNESKTLPGKGFDGWVQRTFGTLVKPLFSKKGPFKNASKKARRYTAYGALLVTALLVVFFIAKPLLSTSSQDVSIDLPDDSKISVSGSSYNVIEDSDNMRIEAEMTNVSEMYGEASLRVSVSGSDINPITWFSKDEIAVCETDGLIGVEVDETKTVELSCDNPVNGLALEYKGELNG